MSKYLIIDGNSVGFAAHSTTPLRCGDLQTQAVFGFVKSLREMRVQYRDYTPIVLWDGRAQWRFQIHPEYKSNRDNDPKKIAIKEAYVTQRPYINKALTTLGVRQMTALDREADDLAGYLVGELSQKPENDIVLITGDQDWLQLLRKNVRWVDWRDGSRNTGLSNLMDRTGFPTPYAFLEGKCLMGDSSDCISGVGGIGKKGAPEFIAEFGSVREFWNRCNSGVFVPKNKCHKNLADGPGKTIFFRNFRLMQLLRPAPLDKSKVTSPPAVLDGSEFLKLCEELMFTSILRDADTFLEPFKSGTKNVVS